MPENLKLPRSASPVARCGAGDISERELSRERHNLQTTPPARLQPVHPKKKLFFTPAPVSKFTAKSRTPTPHLARIRNCLEDFRALDQNKVKKMSPKAASMEDLTPTKRMKKEAPKTERPIVRSPGVHGVAEQEAAARVARFMVVASWRRRREDVRCLRRTLEFQLSYSERLRLQVSALKSLLDSDNAKVRLAMRELDRLKQLLREKDIEKAVLEREKQALENDICAAEDRASEMSIGWRNCRNDLEASHAQTAAVERTLRNERAAFAIMRADRDRLHNELSVLQEQASKQEELRGASEAAAAELRTERDELRRALEQTMQALSFERACRDEADGECVSLSLQLAQSSKQEIQLSEECKQLREQLDAATKEVQLLRKKLDWWPKPITRLWMWARGSGLQSALVSAAFSRTWL